MKQETSFISVFFSTFKIFSCLLILVVLPLSFLYFLDSYLLVPAKLHVVDTAIMAIILTLIAFLGAVLAGILYFITSLFLSKENAARVVIVYGLLGFVVAAYEFNKTAKLWMLKVFPSAVSKLGIIDILVVMIFLAALIYVFIFRDKVLPEMKKERDRCFKAVCVLVGASIVIFFVQVSSAYFFDSSKKMAASNLTDGSSAGMRPNVILITFDALSAEDMSLHGYKLKTTPHIDSFAGESYSFKNMYANANWTRPGVASILTGTYPSTHRLILTGMHNCFLPDELKNKNIAAVLKGKGYRTAAIISNLAYAHPSTNDTYQYFDYAPFDTDEPGFRKYAIQSIIPNPLKLFFLSIGSSAHYWSTDIAASYLHFFYKRMIEPIDQTRWNTQTGAPAELTFELAHRYLQRAKPPFFLWIHVVPPHFPYLPKDPFKKQFLKEDIFLTLTGLAIPGVSLEKSYPDELQPVISKLRLRYDEFILNADHDYSLFLNKIRTEGYLDTSIIMISSDHGESFERNHLAHRGPDLYNNLIHIPLIIRMPKQKTSKIIDQPAEQIDVAPTILDLLNIDIPQWMEGESMKKAMEGSAMSHKPKFSMQLEGNRVEGKIARGTIAVMKDDYKYIFYLDKQKSELYNMKNDPQERTDLVKIEKMRADAMHRLITQSIFKRKD